MPIRNGAGSLKRFRRNDQNLRRLPKIPVKCEFIHYEWNLPLTYSVFLLHPETIKEE